MRALYDSRLDALSIDLLDVGRWDGTEESTRPIAAWRSRPDGRRMSSC